MSHPFILHFLFLSISLHQTLSKCVYRVKDDLTPFWVDAQPHLISNLTQCLQYNDKYGCCDVNNDIGQIKSYTQIDGVFGSQGDACDICAINLKRFWCQYACSPRQSDFMNASKQLVPYPDPLHPGKTIYVQKIILTVHSKAACDMFKSCSRVAFVNAVSAMKTPAGFLNFQGHNAVNDAFQYIDVIFSNTQNNSLWFDTSQQSPDPQHQSLLPCNYTTSKQTIHEFPFSKNCTCNNCQDACNNNNGFKYTQSSIFQQFNWILISIVWGIVIGISVGITIYRNIKQKRQTMEVKVQ